MSVAFDRRKLLRAVQLAASIAPRNSPKLCLAGVLLKCRKNGLTVHGTDTEAAIAVEVACDGEVWEALPNAVRFVAVLSESTDDEITLGKEDDTLVIKGMFAETVLKDCDEPEAFPSKTPADPLLSFILPAESFSTALKRVTFCCASESARYAMTGTRIEPMDGEIILIATDGRRMAVETLSCPASVLLLGDYIVPERAVKLILGACRGVMGEVEVGLTKNDVTVKVDGVTIVAGLLEGRFPTWREVFPKKYDYTIPLNTGALLSVTRQAATMMTEDTRGIEYTFGQSKLSAKSASKTGRARIEMPVAFDEKLSTTMAGDLVAEMLGYWPNDTEVSMRGVRSNTVVAFEFPGNHRALIVPLGKAVAS